MTALMAPFEENQINSLKAFQERSIFHPYTCHESEHGTLSVSYKGMYCERCNYIQKWADEWTTDWSWEVGEKEVLEAIKLPNKDITEFQKEIGQWVDHNFGTEDRVVGVTAVVEEAGELTRAVRKQAQKIRGTYQEWDDEIRKEAGDVFIALCQAAHTCGFDLYEEIVKRWNDVSKRDFVKDSIGHGLPEE